MPDEEDTARFIVNISAEYRMRSEALAASIDRGVDPIVNYLKSDDPMQYVVKGLLLCEVTAKELIAKYVPDVDLRTSKFIELLGSLHISGFLDSSEIPPYKKLNNLRNRVAHQLDYQVTKKDAADI